MVRDHNGEPSVVKELPIEANRLQRRCIDEKMRVTPNSIYKRYMVLKEEQHQLAIETCKEFELSLNRTASHAIDMLTEVVELNPRQLVRVTETVVNAMVLSANAGHEYSTSLSSMGLGQSDVDNQLYYAVEGFEETQRELIADLWTKVNN